MKQTRSLIAFALFGAAVVMTIGLVDVGQPETHEMEKRVIALEKSVSELSVRVAALEVDGAVRDGGASKKEQIPKSEDGALDKRDVIRVELSNKRFRDTDWQRGIVEAAVLWDAKYFATGLSREARAIKGTLVFADLFGEVILRVNVTIDEPMRVGGSVAESGTGFEYNQFIDSHAWVRVTDLDDMKIWYEVKQILYEDGTTESFK